MRATQFKRRTVRRKAAAAPKTIAIIAAIGRTSPDPPTLRGVTVLGSSVDVAVEEVSDLDSGVGVTKVGVVPGPLVLPTSNQGGIDNPVPFPCKCDHMGIVPNIKVTVIS